MNKIFLRSGALCVLVGAIILAIGYLLRTNIEKEYIDEFASTQGLLSSILVAIGSLLFLFGLPALFVAQNLYTSKTGIAASALSFIGIAAFHLGTLALYFVMPVLVTHDATTRALVYSDEPPFPRFAMFWAGSLLIQVTGLIWIGIKALKNTVHSKWIAILLIVGGLIFLSAPFLYFPLIKPANTITMLGFSLWSVEVLKSQVQKKQHNTKHKFSAAIE